MAPPVFPSLPGITYPVRRTSRWTGSAHDALSGKRTRTSFYSFPVYLYELPFNFLRTAAAFTEWQQLSGFINQLFGGSGLFLYNDVNDNSSGTNQSFGTGDAVTPTFQLVRSLGGFIEPVFFPDQPIPTVRVNGVATAAYTVSATGSIVFNSAPAGGATLDWTGTFKWPCRFDSETTDFDNFMSSLFELKALKFSTEKLV